LSPAPNDLDATVVAGSNCGGGLPFATFAPGAIEGNDKWPTDFHMMEKTGSVVGKVTGSARLLSRQRPAALHDSVASDGHLPVAQPTPRAAAGIPFQRRASGPQVGTQEISRDTYRHQMEMNHAIDAESRARNSGAAAHARTGVD
jgi:hypothetical protein